MILWTVICDILTVLFISAFIHSIQTCTSDISVPFSTSDEYRDVEVVKVPDELLLFKPVSRLCVRESVLLFMFLFIILKKT